MTENESHDNSNADKNDRLNQKRFVVEKATLVVLAIYTLIACYQAFKMRTATKAATESAGAAKSAAETAAASMVLGERPWIAIKHRIVSPLTFNVGGRASGIPIAMMTLEDTHTGEYRPNRSRECTILGGRYPDGSKPYH